MSFSVFKAPELNSVLSLSNSGVVTATPLLSFNIWLNKVANVLLAYLPSLPTAKPGNNPSTTPNPAIFPSGDINALTSSRVAKELVNPRVSNSFDKSLTFLSTARSPNLVEPKSSSFIVVVC